MALIMRSLLLLALGCRDPIEPVDESARGDFIMGGVINTEVVGYFFMSIPMEQVPGKRRASRTS